MTRSETKHLWDNDSSGSGLQGVVATITEFLDIMSVGVLPASFMQSKLVSNLRTKPAVLSPRQILLVLKSNFNNPGAEAVPVIDLDYVAVTSHEDAESLKDKLNVNRTSLPELLPNFHVRPDLLDQSGASDDSENENISLHDQEADAWDATEVVRFLRDIDVDAMRTLVRQSEQDDFDLRMAVRENIAALAQGCESTAKSLLDWFRTDQSRKAKFEAIQDLSVLLDEQNEIEKDTISDWQEYTEALIDGDRPAGSDDLLDVNPDLPVDAQSSVRNVLRALTGLFRCANLELSTVEQFLEANSAQVGPKVRELMLSFSSSYQRGFGSVQGVCKSDLDLYAIGSCVSAGQSNRISVHPSGSGYDGGYLALDGQPLDRFQKFKGEKTEAAKQIDKLKGQITYCGFDVESSNLSDSRITVKARKRKSTVQLTVEISHETSDSSTGSLIKFSTNLHLEKKRRKKWPSGFAEMCLEQGLRSVVCLNQFPNITLLRDQVFSSCDDEEIQDHIQALLRDSETIQERWIKATNKS